MSSSSSSARGQTSAGHASAANGWEDLLYRLSREPRPVSPSLPLTLILPASAQVGTPNREFLLHSPLEGPSYIATVAENAGWDVEMIDMRLGVSGQEAARRACARGGVVAMPTFADSYVHNEQVLRLIKQSSPDLPTVAGGTLISSLPEPLMQALMIDYAVLHEGELTFLELLDHLRRGGSAAEAVDIQGLAIRLPDGTVHYTAPRPQIRDLDAVPIPDLSLYPATRQDSRIPEIGLTTARGCYGRCTFCFVNIRKLRFKSPGRVREELFDLKEKHGVEYIYVNDLTFTADLERARSICDVLKETGIVWSCSTRVEKVPFDLLRHMHACGCRDIWYGVESVDSTVLELTKKDQSVEQIREAIRQTLDAGIKVMANFIVGLPGETVESLEAMHRFVEEEEITPASVKYLAPFPGTPIYEDAVRRGLIRDHLEYLQQLSQRRVNDEQDEIINVTDLPEGVLRDAFSRLIELRDRRIRANGPKTNARDRC